MSFFKFPETPILRSTHFWSLLFQYRRSFTVWSPFSSRPAALLPQLRLFFSPGTKNLNHRISSISVVLYVYNTKIYTLSEWSWSVQLDNFTFLREKKTGILNRWIHPGSLCIFCHPSPLIPGVACFRKRSRSTFLYANDGHLLLFGLFFFETVNWFATLT